MSSLDQNLVEQLKKEAFDYSLLTNQTTDKAKVFELFQMIYAQKDFKLTEDMVEILDSPTACQRRANKLCNTEGVFYSDIAHNSLSHATHSYRYLKGSKNEYDEKLMTIAEKFNCYYYAIALDGALLVSEYPTNITVDENHKFHNMTGPALTFKDGETFYFVRNIETTKEVVETPAEEYTSELFESIDNADVRAAIVEKLGNDKVLEFMEAEQIEEFDEYRLISAKFEDERRNYMSMVCPSTGHVHYLGAFPNTDLKQSLAMSFGQKTWKRPLIEDGRVNEVDATQFEVGDTLYRHGDVQLKKTDKTLKDFPIKKGNDGILHVGTNNTHRMEGDWHMEGDIVVLRSEGVLSHAEHERKFGKMTIPAGVYRKFIHTQYNHFLEEAEAVRD